MATPGRSRIPPVENRRTQFAISSACFASSRSVFRFLPVRAPAGTDSLESAARRAVLEPAYGSGALRNRADFGFPPQPDRGARLAGRRAAADARQFHGSHRAPRLAAALLFGAGAERLRARDTAPREFLDIFNHRMVSLFYQAWEKFRFTVAYERGDEDRLSPPPDGLAGPGDPRPGGSPADPDEALVFRCDSLRPRRVPRRPCGCC